MHGEDAMRGVGQYGNRRILCVFPRYTSVIRYI